MGTNQDGRLRKNAQPFKRRGQGSWVSVAQECALKQERTKGKDCDQLMGADEGFDMKGGPISKSV